MNFMNLEYFVTVAEELNISNAAKQLNISQQSLSNHIAKLESELNRTLFVRGRPLVLTNEGYSFYQTAKEILRLKNEYEHSLGSTLMHFSELRIGISNTIARSILPGILPAFFKKYPATYIKIVEDAPENLKKSVGYDGLDFVIGSISVLPKSYNIIKLCDKRQVLVVHKEIMNQLFGEDAEKYRARFQKGASLKDFEKAPFIRMNSAYSAGRIFNEYCRKYDISPDCCVDLINSDVAFHLACAGVGVLVYSKLFYDTLGKELCQLCENTVDVFPLPALSDIDYICAYHHRDHQLSVVAQDFINMIQAFFENYRQS